MNLIDMPLSQERETRTPPFIAITCLSILATMPGEQATPWASAKA